MGTSGSLRKPEILRIVEHFAGAHRLGDDNTILGDFNFVDGAIDKGKGTDARDRIISPPGRPSSPRSTCTTPFVSSYRARWRTPSMPRLVNVNEETVQTVTNYVHHPTPTPPPPHTHTHTHTPPFNLAH